MSDITMTGKISPLIDPGEYLAVLDHHETNRSAFGGKPKVYLIFRLVDPGYIGIELYAAYNVRELSGRSGRNGRFKLTRRQDLTLHLARIIPDFRLDRVSLNPLKACTVKVSVRTVSKDYKQRALPTSLQYSVIDQILGIEDGGITIRDL